MITEKLPPGVHLCYGHHHAPGQYNYTCPVCGRSHDVAQWIRLEIGKVSRACPIYKKDEKQ